MLHPFVRLAVCALGVSAAMAQVPTQIINPCLQQACYFATVSGTISSSGTSKLTIQQPATGARQINYIAAVAQCAGQSFSVDQAENGTAATTTAGTAVALIPTTATASAKVFTASNVGSGTATGPTLAFTAGNPQVIDLSQRTTGTVVAATTNNYTITVTNTGSGSCTGGISIYWSERL